MNITCPNCGATYDAKQYHHTCPYCSFEITEGAIDDTLEYIQELNESTEEYKKLPEKVAKKKVKKTTVIFALILVLGALVFLGVFLYPKVKDYINEKRSIEYLQGMADAYAEKDYAAVARLYYEPAPDYDFITRYGNGTIYQEITDMQNDYTWMENHFDHHAELIEEAEAMEDYHDSELYEEYYFEFVQGLTVLLDCYQAEVMDYPFDNPEDYEYFKEKIYYRFIDYYGWTEEELTEICANYKLGDLYKLVPKYQEHMWENRYGYGRDSFDSEEEAEAISE